MYTLVVQDALRPQCDIFGSKKEPVGSIVVIPLFWGGQAEGGLYFTLQEPCTMQTLKAAMLALTAHVRVLLHQEPGCSIQAIRDFANDAVVSLSKH
jgi:hypothetical protein